MELQMPISIKKIVSRISHWYPAIFEVMDGQGNKIVDANGERSYNPAEKSDSAYEPVDDDDSAYYPAYGGPNSNQIVAVDTVNALNDNNYAIIINSYRNGHHGPIAWLETNHYHILTDPKDKIIDKP